MVFKPGGAYRFLGIPLSLLTNQSVLIEDVWQSEGERYRDLLLEARTLADQLKGLVAMLDARCQRMGTQQLAWQRIAWIAAGLLVRDSADAATGARGGGAARNESPATAPHL